MKMRHGLLVLFGIAFLLASGCGSSGGGSGRYIVPGEIPNSGSNGTDTGTGTGGETNPDSLILSAWDDFKYGAFSSAIGKFNQVLVMTNLTQSQKADAYNGLGWSQAKSTGMESGFSSFSQAADTNAESQVGLASSLIQRGQKSGFSQAVTLLEKVGLTSTSYRFTSTHPIGVTNAEAHAMLAFAYFWRNQSGDQDRARAQISVAHQEDGSADGVVSQIYGTLKAMGLTGI
ncbi:MAG: hypothetical protein HQM09_03295 [Candidatus Riflebacteria bacterium]|nr:hypothetical protein [Candidatus Riflebacteria bacterium]